VTRCLVKETALGYPVSQISTSAPDVASAVSTGAPARSVALGEPTGTFELDGTPGDEEMHMTGIRNPHDLARLQSSAPEHRLLLTDRDGPVVAA